MRESECQRKIIQALEAAGWYVVKIIQTNRNGWPDLQALKDGVCVFIEVKAPNGKLSELQKYRHKQLIKQGFTVLTLTQITHHDIARLSHAPQGDGPIRDRDG